MNRYSTKTSYMFRGAAAALIASLAFAGAASADHYFQGFEDPNWEPNQVFEDWQNWHGGDIERAVSGTGGIASADGVAHAIITNLSYQDNVFGVPTLGAQGPFTRLGGYTAAFGNGFTTSIDVYLDPSWIDELGFDIDVSVNDTDGDYKRGFVWHVGMVDGDLLVNASNNSDRSFNAWKLLNENNGHNHTITQTGWYTLETVFYADGGLLWVDYNLRDSGGALLYTVTRGGNPADTIPDEVGGNRLMWFVYCNIDGLALDNVSRHNMPLPQLALNADETCYNAGVGDTVSVDIDMSNMVDDITGGQFFLQFDDSVLSFDSHTLSPDFQQLVHLCEGETILGVCIPQPGRLEIAVGVGPLDPGVSGDATLVTLHFEATDESCSTAGLVSFVPGADTKLTYGLGSPVYPDLADLEAITIDGTAPSFDTFPSDTTVECDVSMVNIAGTHLIATSYRVFEINDSVLFQPLQGPVSVTGWADISDFFSTNSSTFFGLIAKQTFEAWDASSFGPYAPNTFFGFLDTAYGVFNSASGGRLGLGQQIGTSGEVAQSYAVQGIGGFASGIQVLLGPAHMELHHGPDSATQTYSNNLYDVLTGTNGHATDWSQGAYAFVGSFVAQPNLTSQFDFTFSQSNLPDPSVTGEPTASDNCDPNPVTTYVDTIVPGACDETFVIEREWTVTDACGNWTSQTQIITIQDTTAPTLVDVPSDITVHADAGTCDAVVSITPPTATDNCDANPLVTYVRNDGLALADPFPQGTTVITWTATDCTGNYSTDTTEVTNTGLNLMWVRDTMSFPGLLQGSPSMLRGITFELFKDGVLEETLCQTVFFGAQTSPPGVSGPFTVIAVPCGDYDCVQARDALHTLRAVGGLTEDSGAYEADFTGSPLIGGDLNDDGVVDILDFGIVVDQWNVNYGMLGFTDCNTPFPNADIGGSGIVDLGDFTFIQQNFLLTDAPPCPGQAKGPAGFARTAAQPQPRGLRSITVAELHRRGLGHLAIADLNGDGVVDEVDIALFFAGVRP